LLFCYHFRLKVFVVEEDGYPCLIKKILKKIVFSGKIQENTKLPLNSLRLSSSVKVSSVVVIERKRALLLSSFIVNAVAVVVEIEGDEQLVIIICFFNFLLLIFWFASCSVLVDGNHLLTFSSSGNFVLLLKLTFVLA